MGNNGANTGSLSITANNIALTSNIVIGSLTLAHNGSVTLASSVSKASGGTGILTKQGPGTLTVTGAFSGFVSANVNGGIMVLGNTNALGTMSNVTVVSGAALQLAAAGGINLSPSLTVNISGTGPAAGGALESLGGTNNIAGTVLVSGGATIVADAGTLTLAGLNLAGGSVTLGGAGGISVAGVVAGTFGVIKSGVGTVTLNGSNTYTGATAVNAGVLVLANSKAVGSTPSVTVAAGGGLQLAVAGGINLASTIAFFIIAGAGPSGGGAIESLGGANSIAGPITVTLAASIGADAGTLTLSNASFTIIQGTITFTGAGNIVVASGVASPYSPGSPGLLETQGPGNLDLAAVGDIASYGWDTVFYPFMGETNGNDNSLQAVSRHIWATNDTWFYQGQINVPNFSNTGKGYLSPLPNPSMTVLCSRSTALPI